MLSRNDLLFYLLINSVLSQNKFFSKICVTLSLNYVISKLAHSTKTDCQLWGKTKKTKCCDKTLTRNVRPLASMRIVQWLFIVAIGLLITCISNKCQAQRETVFSSLTAVGVDSNDTKFLLSLSPCFFLGVHFFKKKTHIKDCIS